MDPVIALPQFYTRLPDCFAFDQLVSLVYVLCRLLSTFRFAEEVLHTGDTRGAYGFIRARPQCLNDAGLQQLGPHSGKEHRRRVDIGAPDFTVDGEGIAGYAVLLLDDR